MNEGERELLLIRKEKFSIIKIMEIAFLVYIYRPCGHARLIIQILTPLVLTVAF